MTKTDKSIILLGGALASSSAAIYFVDKKTDKSVRIAKMFFIGATILVICSYFQKDDKTKKIANELN